MGNKIINKKIEVNAKFILPNYESCLKINKDLQIDFMREKPNWWFRMWQKLFFGFEWE